MNGIACACEGRVTNRGDLKYTATGKAVLAFSIPVDTRDGTQWVRVSCWEATAERLAETLHDGATVYIEGALALSTWQTKGGEQRAGLNVSASRVELLAGNVRRGPARPPSGSSPRYPLARAADLAGGGYRAWGLGYQPCAAYPSPALPTLAVQRAHARSATADLAGVGSSAARRQPRRTRFVHGFKSPLERLGRCGQATAAPVPDPSKSGGSAAGG